MEPQAENEADALLEDLQYRLADTLTTAAPGGGLAVLDFSVASPHATSTGVDCCQAIYDRKVVAYSPAEHGELALQGIVYRPVMFSVYGREHLETTELLNHMAHRTAWKYGLRCAWLISRWMRARIGVALVSWHTAMIMACQHGLDAARVSVEGRTRSQIRAAQFLHMIFAAMLKWRAGDSLWHKAAGVPQWYPTVVPCACPGGLLGGERPALYPLGGRIEPAC